MKLRKVTTDMADSDFPLKQGWKLWKYRRYVVTFMGTLGFFNLYASRGSFSVALVAMTQTMNVSLENGTVVQEPIFKWDSRERGLILGSFFYGYIFTQMLGGILTARYGGHIVFGCGVGISAILALLSVGAANMGKYPLIVVRILMGLFQTSRLDVFQSLHSAIRSRRYGHSMASEVSLYDQRACEYQCSNECCGLNSCPDRQGWSWAGDVWHTECDSYSQQRFQRHRWKGLIVAPVIVDNGGCGCEDETVDIRGLAVDWWSGWDTTADSGGDMSKYNKSCQSKCKKIESTGAASTPIDGFVCTDDGKCCQKARAKHRCQSINSTNCHYEIFRHEECDETLLPRLHPSALLPSHIRRLQQSSDTSTKANRSALDGEGLPRRSGEFGKLFRTLLPFLLFFGMLPFLQAVASDSDAFVVGGPNPKPQPWIPVVAYLEPLPRSKAPKCDQTYVSRSGGPTNGTFTAPLLINPTNHSRQCLYIFLAGPGQRVEVVFTSFNLRGTPPDGAAVGELPACGSEYMDVYAEVQSSDPADLINSPFGGRFCGPIPPRRRISLYRAIALSFFTNKNMTTPDVFGGRYSFINESEFDVGQPVIGSPCSYIVNISQNRTGSIISPTYPGAYPKDMSCTYQFIGKHNQRVRLEFRDFDLFFGGPHCPFDFVKVYDGIDNTSALVGTYCGQQRNLVLYSSESNLFVHFYTLQRTANTQNRGFKGIFEFSESFVKLDFIRENDGEHIRGSECDQKILSKKESSGFVYSPNYPYPFIPKVVCRYFIYGMQDAQNLERVKLEFSIFEIPKMEHKEKSESNCTDGYLKIYLKGQETTDSYDKFDYELCGSEIPPPVVSDGPRLVMVFSSGELQGRGFKAKYSFETEYKIPGTAAPDGTCSFTYRSTSRKKGEFNSPRYPSNYPSETNCSYLFLATPNEQVTIVFDNFKVKADNANTTGGAYGINVCLEDWLEMYVVYRDGSDRFLGRYCSLTAPGPVESPRGAVGIRVFLHTDQENVASGFKARYIFEAAKSVFGDCGGNYSGLDSGVITSPNFPANYHGPGKGLASRACNWYITARIGYKILLNFEMFSVEGDPAGRGCPAAVLRLWTFPESDAAPQEVCGEKGSDHWHYMSQGQTARVSFTTTDKTIGAQGFRIVWTEVQDTGPGPPSSIANMCESTYHYQCEHSGYCIAEKLRCDGMKNCGPGDDSDEMHCMFAAPDEDHGVLIITSIAAGSFLICLLCTLCHRRRKRRHLPRLGLHRNAAHYDSTTSATGLGSSRRHLQGGSSLSGSLHAINSGSLPIPPAPLPPTSVPPHICINDEFEDPDDLFGNIDRFSNNGESV